MTAQRPRCASATGRGERRAPVAQAGSLPVRRQSLGGWSSVPRGDRGAVAGYFEFSCLQAATAATKCNAARAKGGMNSMGALACREWR